MICKSERADTTIRMEVKSRTLLQSLKASYQLAAIFLSGIIEAFMESLTSKR